MYVTDEWYVLLQAHGAPLRVCADGATTHHLCASWQQ
jgi:hypothetical protein